MSAVAMDAPRTIIDKIWDAHTIVTRDGGETLLHVDRVLVQEGTFHAFAKMRREGRRPRDPSRIFAFADHYVPTAGRDRPIPDPEIADMIAQQKRDCDEFGIARFGMRHRSQGILHVVAPELGITLPGLVMAGADSHTSTHGALGAFAFGVGASEAAHAMVVGGLWRKRPKTMSINVEDTLPVGTTPKDLALAIMRKLGPGGAAGHAIEYAGPGIRALSVEGRMTVCNMSIEGGARAGLVAPDDRTIAYVSGRKFAPEGTAFDQACADWHALTSDDGAPFDSTVSLSADDIVPLVSWGTSPDQIVEVTGQVPDPSREPDPDERQRIETALSYMQLRPGTRLEEIAVDRVFIGSCTNARLEDLREAAEIARGRHIAVPAMVVPGSQAVRRAAEAEGLDRVFVEAGFEWREPGCSMCVAINGDRVAPGERCASTSNRNFEGRQGRGALTHLMSPPMAAAAAVTGRLTDARKLSSGSDG